jgi:hypothetical protein
VSFFTKPIAGLRPADSITIALATGIGVAAIYGSDVGPVSDVHATAPGDSSIGAAIKKAGVKSWILVAGITLLTRDLNVVFIGGSMVILEHLSYLHADMASPAQGGGFVATPQSYQPAGGTQLQAVS